MKISLIIPTRYSVKFLPNLINSIEKQKFRYYEVIVVDEFSNDGTKEYLKKKNLKFFQSGPERSIKRNFGAKKSIGELLYFIDSDMILTECLLEDIVKIMDKNKNLYALYVKEKSFGDSFWAKCKILEKKIYANEKNMSAARVFRAEKFNEINGYDENCIGVEDFEISERLENLYPNCIGFSNEYILHNEGQLTLVETLKKKFYYGNTIGSSTRISKLTQRKLFKRSSIITRLKLFLKYNYLFFKQPVVFIGMVYMKFLELSFGFFGYLSAKSKILRINDKKIYKK